MWNTKHEKMAHRCKNDAATKANHLHFTNFEIMAQHNKFILKMWTQNILSVFLCFEFLKLH